MEQLSIDTAKAAGEAGMLAAAQRAERVNPGWQEIALLFVAKYAQARKQADRFTAEDVVDPYMADEGFPHPPDERAFGVVVKKAIAKGLIAYADSHGRRRKGHGSRCDRYKSLVAGQPWTAIVARMTL